MSISKYFKALRRKKYTSNTEPPDYDDLREKMNYSETHMSPAKAKMLDEQEMDDEKAGRRKMSRSERAYWNVIHEQKVLNRAHK